MRHDHGTLQKRRPAIVTTETNPTTTTTADEPFPDDATLLAVEEALRQFIGEAGKIVMERRASLGVEYKGGNKTDPVTEVDRAVEAYLTQAVAGRFPEHAVLGEEGQDPKGVHEYEWIVDPVDGTLNFVTGLPLYGVSVGVLHRRRPVVGALLFPVTGEMLHARLGGGAFRNGEPIRVRPKAEGKRSLVAGLPGSFRAGFKADRGFRSRLGETRSLGSIAYEIGVVAMGTLDFALFRGPKIWDVAGGAPIVTEAGGRVVYYSRRRKSWLPLDRFIAPPKGGLRAWTQPVLLGSAQAVEELSPHLAPRYAPALLVAASHGYQAARWGYTQARSVR
ncbi:MAG: inositol monophosphatase [Chloroflexota bacterium]|nr:inositol monophosphatase [Chloroflexota bacterium]